MVEELAVAPLEIRGSLADSIYLSLRDGISEGQLQPGFRLREVEIARHFGVSTTPVREALQRLQYDGLVESHAHRGASVASVEWNEIHSLLVVRELLEVYAVKRVAQTYTIHDFDQVRSNLSGQADAVARDDIPEFVRLDREFHMTIIRMTGNDPLVKFTDTVHTQLQQARNRIARGRRSISSSYAEHEVVFAAIERGDADAAEAATHAHVQATIKAITDLIEMESAEEDD